MKTIEEKAKAYDDAIERVKRLVASKEIDVADMEFIFPELRESEDERIRKKLIGIFTNQSLCDVYNLKSEDVLAYLEKQKEQKPIEFKNDELVEIIKGEFEGFRRLLKKKGIDYEPQRSYWEGFARLFDSSAREYVKEQKEQKPVENNVIIPQFHIGDYIKPKAYNEEHLIKDINKNGYVLDIDMIIPFKDEDVWQLAEHKPAEWSEEDKNIFNLALDLIKHSDDCDGILDKELAVKWFAELPSRFIPQPKQEWNTHDKAAVNCIVRCLDGQFVSEAARKQCLEWFNKHRRDFLNSPSWKPSEEQMEALENSTALTEEQGMALYSLVRDLKKL